MKNKIKRMVSVLLLVVCALSFSAQATVYESKEFRKTEASLSATSSTLYLDFYVKTNTINSQLGIKSIKLYDVTTGSNKIYAGPMSSGIEYQDSCAVPATKGHRYYANVTFYADGYTKQIKTNTITF